ncbi:MAG TPA: FGGY family carbohydrate kinase [Anaerovoracaceae bacterium]|nr:FGGY family carbohydrate kinase [Anaerovoracaceae bacterium]
MNFIGIDIGTTTICAVCINQEGQLLQSKTLPNSSHVNGQTFEALQSPQSILDSCRQLITGMTEQFCDIGAIGISNQMHGILYIDEKGAAVSPLYTWQDERGNENFRAEETYCMKLSRITGYRMATGFGLSTHYYNCVNSCIPDDAVKLCTIGDYVAMRLCDMRVPKMHPSNAASLGLFNIEANQFDAAALRKADISPSILPKITKAEEWIGKMQSGIPVCVAIGDNQASVLGSLDGNSSIHINIGTSSQISLVTDRIAESELMECRPYLFNKYLLVGAPLCGGFSYHILKNFFEESARMMGMDSVDNLYEKMNSAGLEEYHKDGGGLTVDTRFRGTRAEPHLRGSITGISSYNFKPGNLIIALLQGICEELYVCFNSIPNSAANQGPIYASGNGIRLNPLLLKLLEGTFKRSVIILDNKEEASVGAAKAAMLTTKRAQ